MDEEALERSVRYATELYASETATHRWIRDELERRGLPLVQISPLEGRILAILARSIDARRLLEIGTLGGYSALWTLSLLDEQARLTTVEKEGEAAALAREALRRAGEDERAEVRRGDAHDVLPRLSGTPPFDFVFVDADKAGYPGYLETAASLMRPGGLLTADNTFWEGRAAGPLGAEDGSRGEERPDDPDAPRAEDEPDEEDESTRGIRAFNRKLADDPRFEAVIVPVRDGLTVARFVG